MRLPLVLAALLAALALPAGALAQDDGVYIDPDSPTAKEYAVPTDEARREASGGGGQSEQSGGEEAPAFGEGVQPTATPTATATATATAAPAAAATPEETKKERKQRAEREASDEREEEAAAVASATPSPPSTQATPAEIARAAETPDSGVGAWLIIGGIVVAVVAAGVVIGIVLRRRGGFSPVTERG